MKIAALIGGAALACAAASSATASTPFWVQLTGLPATAGGGAVSTDLYYSGPIGFTTTSSVEFTVYCTDLDHNVSPGGWYEYTFGRLDENGQGAPISQPISNEIAQIAVIGKNGTGDLSVAAQAAIWQLAYPGISQSFSGPDAGTIQADFSQLLSRTYSNNGAWGVALIPYGYSRAWPIGGQQEMVYAGVPELSTWAMMLLGFGGLGFARRRRNSAALRAA